MKILVVEDDELNAKTLDFMIRHIGYSCTLAENGWKAVHASIEHDFDLIMMDLLLPDIDGVEATKRILHYCINRKRPIIVAVTAARLVARQHEVCLRAGMDHVIQKPYTMNQIRALLINTERSIQSKNSQIQ